MLLSLLKTRRYTLNFLKQLYRTPEKRVDENRELLELLISEAPEFLEKHPWVVGWIKCNDEAFVAAVNLEKQMGVHRPNATNITYPRPWPIKSWDK